MDRFRLGALIKTKLSLTGGLDCFLVTTTQSDLENNIIQEEKKNNSHYFFLFDPAALTKYARTWCFRVMRCRVRAAAPAGCFIVFLVSSSAAAVRRSHCVRMSRAEYLQPTVIRQAFQKLNLTKTNSVTLL